MRASILAIAVALSGLLASAQSPLASTPRLRGGGVPPQPPPTVLGGGEVLLEVVVGKTGAVAAIAPIRSTPPYTDLLTRTVSGWQFAPATTLVDKRPVPAEATVLVAGVFRPPSLVLGTAPGTPPKAVGVQSRAVPQIASLIAPNYAPTMVGDAMVLIEIELTAKGDARGHRVVSGAAGFDAAALDAVRKWRFVPPAATPEPQFVYAVLGFRSPTVTGR